MGGAEAMVGEAVVGHAHEDSCGSSDAGEGAGEHADEGAEVDERAERGTPARLARTLSGAVEVPRS